MGGVARHPSGRSANRRYVMPRFPYLIGFQVFADHVMVIVIAYAARRPGYWR